MGQGIGSRTVDGFLTTGIFVDDAFFCVMFVLERAVRVYIYNVTWRGGA